MSPLSPERETGTLVLKTLQGMAKKGQCLSLKTASHPILHLPALRLVAVVMSVRPSRNPESLVLLLE